MKAIDMWIGCAEMDTDESKREEEESPVEQDEGPNPDPDNELCSNGENVSFDKGINQPLKESLEDEDQKDQEMDEAEKTDSDEPPLFCLTVVNSYGSQEVQKLELTQTYKLSSEWLV